MSAKYKRPDYIEKEMAEVLRKSQGMNKLIREDKHVNFTFCGQGNGNDAY